MLTKVYTSSVYGIDAHIITIEVNVGGRHGDFGYSLVGLPDNAVKESKDRFFTAIKNSGYEIPRYRITINLAPADVRKEGSSYDLGIALGILASSQRNEDAGNPRKPMQLKNDLLKDFLVLGELSLDGGVQPVKGVLPIAIEARKKEFKAILVPAENAYEAAVVSDVEVYAIESLKQAVDFLNGQIKLNPIRHDTRDEFFKMKDNYGFDFAEVKGQENIKRALEVAAAGGHNVILIGPPGSGKTMLAKRLPTILPPLTLNEALETTKIHSVAGKLGSQKGLIASRPFRSPHHTISDVALVGGGTFPQPGEISLAHNGVLFLDELPEFNRSALEVMRQPLEERTVSISRAKFSVDFPASFMLVASMNPCPCGFYNHPDKECICSSAQVQKYMGKISGPLLDRIDIHIEVTPIPFNELSSKTNGETSTSVRERVMRAREIQQERFKDTKGIYCNAQMPPKMVRKICEIDEAGENLLRTAMNKLGLSARAYDRILKVSRTIADLSDSEKIKTEHLAEAIQYRSLDREGWAG